MQRRLREDGFAAAWHEGRALPPEEIIASVSPVDRLAASGHADAASWHGPLSRREWEVARLLRRGLDNREIAARLVISERTAERHVENIRSKLGFTARTQVAAWVAEHDTSPDTT